MTPTLHEITCTKCYTPRPATNFPHKSGGSRRTICKRCLRQQRRNNRQCIRCHKPAAIGYSRCDGCLKKDAEKAKTKHRRHRVEAINQYGKICKFCREDRTPFLTIDHIDGGGNKHRETIGKGGTKIYTWLRKHNYPPGFQVLCNNCNSAKNTIGEERLSEMFNPTFEAGAGI